MRYSDRLQLIKLLAENTNRQLIKEYRDAVDHLNYVGEHRNEGSDWHLGEPMHVVFNDAKVYLNMVINEFASRDYKIETVKHVPALIEFKTLKQLGQDKEAKIIAIEAKKIETEKTNPVYISNGTVITKEQIKKLVLNNGLTITDLIDVVIEINGFVGVGLISLGDNLKEYTYSKIHKK
jgi:hypothetical protein